MAAPAPDDSVHPLVARMRDFVLPVGIIASVLVILVPLPPMLMDLLLASNITVAVILLLTTIYVQTPLEFSIFPSLLLATTLGRLVLNVATTRLILTRADAYGMDAAGGVIKAFGEFVAGDNLVVGLIIFIIIVVIQFVVITKGATRISEVAARFALDGMPGRQMAIDADLNAGIIDEKEAQQRRQEITDQADFFGAMDGASKFVRGDAIAGIVITVINIIGGLVIGYFEYNMSLSASSSLFTQLTIGDGLVSQVPAFLISLAAGLLVTRSTAKTNLPGEFISQLFSRPQALAISGCFVGALIFTNLPRIPLAMIGIGCGTLAVVLARKQKSAASEAQAPEEPEETGPADDRIEDYLTIDPMEIELGIKLVRMADPNRSGNLIERITKIRQKVAQQVGIIVPRIRIRDSQLIDKDQYRIKIADMPVAEWSLVPAGLLAIETGMLTGEVEGIPTQDPAYGTPALWIDPTKADRAELAGYMIVEPVAVLATHLTEVIREHADELLTRDATKHLTDELKETMPAVVDDLIPNQLQLHEVQQILKSLLRERVPIRQLATILEALGEVAQRTKDPMILVETVRNRLSRAICTQFRNKDKQLFVVTLDPALEDRVRAGIETSERGMFVRLDPQSIQEICQSIQSGVEKLVRAGHEPVILVSQQIRAGLKLMTTQLLPKLVVLSYAEITRDTRIESLAMVTEAARTS